MLAGPGLGDDPGLAEPPGQERLAERVVDLVRAGVGEVLALQVEAQARDRAAYGVARPTAAWRAARLVRHRVGQAIGTIERRRTPGEPCEEVAELGPEDRVLAERVVRGLEPLERGHQRLGHVAATEVALHPPPAGAIRVEQAGMDGRRAEREVGPIVARGAGPLDEERDPERVLGRPDAGLAWSFDARGHVDADRGDGPERAGDDGRVETAGQRDRQLPGDRRGQAFRRAHPGPARMRPAGRVEEEALDAGVEVGPAARHEVGGHRREIRRLRGRKVEDLPRPASDPGEREGLIAAQLDDVGIDAATISAIRRVDASAVMATMSGRCVPVPAVRARPASATASASASSARRAGHDVEPDRIGPGRDRRQHRRRRR